MRKLKGSAAELDLHIREWHRNKKLQVQRLGQFIWNMMGKPKQSWPELFYCTESAEAKKLAYNDLMEVESDN